MRLVEAGLLVVVVGAGVVLLWGLYVLVNHGDIDNVGGTATTGDSLEITVGPAAVLVASFLLLRHLLRRY